MKSNFLSALRQRFLLTAGQTHDSTQAKSLIIDLDFDRLIADKSYDFDEFIHLLLCRGVEVVIPPRASRKEQRDYDEHLYKERHLIECFINKIKHFRRLFTRFDKLAKRFLGFLHFVGVLIWLR